MGTLNTTMSPCTTFNILLGTNTSQVTTCTTRSVFIVSVLVTSSYRLGLLISCLYLGGNSVFVQLHPPGIITPTTSCNILTVVQGGQRYSTYHKSKFNLEKFPINDDPNLDSENFPIND